MIRPKRRTLHLAKIVSQRHANKRAKLNDEISSVATDRPEDGFLRATPDPKLAGKQKGIKQILKERELRPAEGLRLECPPADRKSTSCRPEGRCCARNVLKWQRKTSDNKNANCRKHWKLAGKLSSSFQSFTVS